MFLKRWNHVNRYPEVVSTSLRERVAAHHNCTVNEVIVCNGAAESIYLIAQLFTGKKSTIVIPAFSEYEDSCLIFDHEVSFLSWKAALELPFLKSDLLFICNPNNPTGHVFPDLEYWLKLNPHCTFVIDEAFIDFTLDLKSIVPLVKRYPNLIVMRSLTKTYAIPGLRLGYMLAHEEIVNRIMAIKPPWTVNAMAAAAGEFIFANWSDIQLPIEKILEDKARFVLELKQNDAIQIEDSSTHFYWKNNGQKCPGAQRVFAEQSRSADTRRGQFQSLTRQHFRIVTLSFQYNQLLIKALEEWKALYY
ncbi:aminotransferase class I/II-fold pyridoxal phosphate-dependent enzyme [Paucibacter sp. O1-1]|nr:aminotransferase class I/II-fold pyridoxal phosphate-dependent enzyme [Paucibacter sp. O1-1]MDA3825993.1 aminotransferase class I/II-fold pyridoxal phosphate-dependent enzyme [Paucibacter sp. O1-1]